MPYVMGWTEYTHFDRIEDPRASHNFLSRIGSEAVDLWNGLFSNNDKLHGRRVGDNVPKEILNKILTHDRPD